MTISNSKKAFNKILGFIKKFFKSEDIKTYLLVFFSNNNYLVDNGLLYNAPSYVANTPNWGLLETIYEELSKYIARHDTFSEEEVAAVIMRHVGFALTNKTTSIKTEKGEYIDHISASYGLSLMTFIAAEGILGREIDESIKNKINCRILYGREKFSNR